MDKCSIDMERMTDKLVGALVSDLVEYDNGIITMATLKDRMRVTSAKHIEQTYDMAWITSAQTGDDDEDRDYDPDEDDDYDDEDDWDDYDNEHAADD